MLNDRSGTCNLSSFEPNMNHLNVLEKGLTFIPKPKLLPVSKIIENKNKLVRSLALKYNFRHSEIPFNSKIKTFREKSTWTPDIVNFPPHIQNTIGNIERVTDKIIKNFDHVIINEADHLKFMGRSNLTRDEFTSLRELKNNANIIIKPADKGGATVIMNREAYVAEAYRQLNNRKYYALLDEPIYILTKPKIRNILIEMHKKQFIDAKQFKYLSGPDVCRKRIFYLLPKIHKPRESWPQINMPEGRPIVSDVNSESYRISEYIDFFINPLSCLHPSYLKNTYDFVEQIRDQIVEEKNLIVTGDVSSLYTNMNINRTLACVKKALANTRGLDPIRPDRELLELLELTLKNNDFEFDGNYYLQTFGTAMGKKYAPALANLYLLDFDNAAMQGIESERGNIKPINFKRYLDDVFFIWPGSVTELEKFEQYLNTVTEGIKIKFEYHEQELNFLDTVIYKEEQEDSILRLKTKVYFKKTDTHQLLHTSSFHPKHTTKGILKSQLLRFKRISSSKLDYDNTCKILFKTLLKRGYTRTNLRNQQKQVWFGQQNKSKNQTKLQSSEKILPIVVNYDIVGQILESNYKKILKDDNFYKNFKMVTAYKNHKNLRKHLVHSELV
jgi:hypothetical protein